MHREVDWQGGMRIASLRCWAYLETMVICGLVAVVAMVRLAFAPSFVVESVLTGDLLTLLALSGITPRLRHHALRAVRGRRSEGPPRSSVG